MKPFFLVFLCSCMLLALVSFASSGKQVQDTSGVWKRNVQPVIVPAGKPPPVILKADTARSYNNPIYWNGIRSAEYQNRGAEDRRNPATDPGAIPDKRVPEQKVLPPQK